MLISIGKNAYKSKPQESQLKNRSGLFICSLIAIGALFTSGSAWAAGVLTLTKEPTSGATVKTGGLITYEIKPACNSNTGNCGTLNITDNLPAGVVLESCSLPPGYSAVGNSCDPGSTVLNIAKDATFQGGDTAVIMIQVRVDLNADPATDIINATTAVISKPKPGTQASITATAAAVDVLEPFADWVHVKDRVTPPPSVEPTWDTDVLYKVQLCANNASGNVELTGVSMVDNYPAGATVVNAGGAVIDAGAHTLTWAINDADISFATLFPDSNLYETQQCVEKSYTLRYPAANFNAGDAIKNTVSSTSNEGYGPATAKIKENIIEPTPSANPYKNADDVLEGEDLVWHINADNSLSNAPVPELVIYETLPLLPAGITAKTVTSGQWNSPPTTNAPLGSDVRAKISYSQTAGLGACSDAAAVYTDLTGGAFIASPAASVTYNLPADTTCVRWEFRDLGADGGVANDYQVPLGWAFTDSPILTQDTTGVAAADIDAKVENCVNSTYKLFDGSTGGSGDVCSKANIENPASDVISAKYIYPSTGNKPGDLIKIRMRFLHDQADSTGPIIDPVVADFLPPELEFVEVGYSSGNPLSGSTESPLGYSDALALAQPEPNYEVINDFAGTGKTLVRFSWSATPPVGALKLDGSPAVANSASFAEGSLVDLVFTVRVKPGTPLGSYTNEMQFFDNGPRFTCNEDQEGVEAQSQADPLDIDGNPATDKLCLSSASAAVISASVLDGSKWIKGDPTLSHIDVTNPSPANNAACPNQNGGFTRYPCVAQTTKGGDFEYLIKLQNMGNEPLKDYIFYDVLPAISDTGVGEPLSTSQRGTEWKAELTAEVTAANQQATDALAQAGASIEYSQAANPCRPEVSSTTTETGWDVTCTNDWGPAPADLSTVTAFRFILPFGDTPWQIIDEMQFSVQMKAPLAAPGSNPTDVNDLHPAWNSFAHRVTQNSNDSRLPTAEPKQVGIIIPKGPKVSIGSVVWADLNNDGAQEVGEAGIDGVTVNLLYANGDPAADQDGVLVPAQLTQNGGQYYFDNLDEGDYVVQVTTPSGGFIPSTTQTTADNDDLVGDSNITGSGVPANTYVSGKFTLSDNGEPENANETSLLPNNGDNADVLDDSNGNMTVDFGFYLPVSIGSTVFYDNNNDGIQSGAGETGISGVTVKLYAADGTTEIPVGPDGILGTADDANGGMVTDASGNYLFDKLVPGSYVVGVIPTAAVPTSSTDIATTNADNQTDGDDNGIQANPGDEAKSPVINLTVGAEPLDAVETAQAGGQETGADNSGDMTVDFGFIPLVSIGSTVFYDLDNNGIQSGAGETGISGVTVKLYAADGTTEILVGPDGILGTADDATGGMVTDGNGDYYFANLPQGDYVVGVTPSTDAPLSSTDIATTTADNQTDGDDNGVQATSGAEAKSPVITLLAGGEPLDAVETGQGGAQDSISDSSGDMTVDFGFFNPVSIGSVVWNDTNNNGIQEAGELGIPNVAVTLLDASDQVVDTQNTDGDGLYFFGGLPAGDYKVKVVSPANFVKAAVQTSDDNDNTANDSNIASSSGSEHTSGLFTLTVGGETTVAEETGGLPGSDDADNASEANGNMTVDFGFYLPVADAVSIGSVVWEDTNNNGVQDSNELGLSGAIVTLLDGNGDPVVGYAPLTTGSDGLYYFGNLPAADYQIQVEVPNGFAPSAIQVADANTDIDNDSNIDTAASVNNTHKSSIVTLTNDGELSGGVNDPEAGVLGGDDQDSSDDNNGNMTVDFGFFKLNPNAVTIGSLVWNDDNDNGKQDEDEMPIAGATVILLDGNGDRVDGITEQLTGSNGLYFFDNLPAGDYKIQVTPPAGYEPSSIQNGTDDDTANDSNIAGDGNTVGSYVSGTVTLTVGGEPAEVGGLENSDNADSASDANGNMTVDFGFIVPVNGPAVSIGSLIWSDTDMDGIQDIGEPVIPNVMVTLLDSNGDPVPNVSSQVTGPDGLYYFGNLPEGSYQVKVTPPAGFVPTFTQVANANADVENDSNIAVAADGDYTSAPVMLSDGQEPSETSGLAGSDGADTVDDNGNMTVDFGFVPTSALGGISGNVSKDIDFDDIADEPLEGVVMHLLNSAGQPVLDPVTGEPITATTDVYGNYEFTNLPPGEYSIKQEQPYGYGSVSDVQGDGIDNLIESINVTAGGNVVSQDYIEKPVPTDVPTLSEWALFMLMMLLAFVGYRQAAVRAEVKF